MGGRVSKVGQTKSRDPNKNSSRANSRSISRAVSRAVSRAGSKQPSRANSRANSRAGSRQGSRAVSRAGSDDEGETRLPPKGVRYRVLEDPSDVEHPPRLLDEEELRTFKVDSRYPLTCPPSPNPSIVSSYAGSHAGSYSGSVASGMSTRYGMSPARRVDKAAVDTPVGHAINHLCGYQPAVKRRRQHVFVMRHAERRDFVEPTWALSTDRPWDPPLTDWGKWQAHQVGMRLKREGWNVTRIVCSPYLRCVETAAEVAMALMSQEDDVPPLPVFQAKPVRASRMVPTRSHFAQQLIMKTINAEATPTSKSNSKRQGETRLNLAHLPRAKTQVKVSIDYGLSEVMSSQVNPDSVQWLPSTAELEALLPEGCVDHPRFAEVELPPWPEKIRHAVMRFVGTIDRIAEQFMDENVLLISHAEAVHASIVRCKKEARVYNILFSAYSHMQRHVFRDPEDEDDKGVGEWRLATRSGTSGVFF
eukprot:jgi/Mesen1/9874/ME000070S09153